jgi:hypothetical protein
LDRAAQAFAGGLESPISHQLFAQHLTQRHSLPGCDLVGDLRNSRAPKRLPQTSAFSPKAAIEVVEFRRTATDPKRTFSTPQDIEHVRRSI